MKPYFHARNSVKKWKGKITDYLPIHDFIDSSKAHLADMRHRAILHSSFGIYIVEQVFGTFIENSSGIKVQVRDVAEQHVLDDMGRIPTVADWLREMPIQEWMGGPTTKRTEVDVKDLEEPPQSEEPSIDDLRRALQHTRAPNFRDIVLDGARPMPKGRFK